MSRVFCEVAPSPRLVRNPKQKGYVFCPVRQFGQDKVPIETCNDCEHFVKREKFETTKRKMHDTFNNTLKKVGGGERLGKKRKRKDKKSKETVDLSGLVDVLGTSLDFSNLTDLVKNIEDLKGELPEDVQDNIVVDGNVDVGGILSDKELKGEGKIDFKPKKKKLERIESPEERKESLVDIFEKDGLITITAWIEEPRPSSLDDIDFELEKENLTLKLPEREPTIELPSEVVKISDKEYKNSVLTIELEKSD